MSQPGAMEKAAASKIDRRYLQWLRRVGLIEGTSTLILFGIAMPLKYLGGMPLAVSIVGSLHGLLFLLLCAMLVLARDKVALSASMVVLGILAAILPFGPFVYDGWLTKHARDATT